MSNQAHITPPSYWPIIGSVGLFVFALGIVNWLHKEPLGVYAIAAGAAILLYMMYGWFREVIEENMAGLGKDPQVESAFKWGMIWFIFSEVMFFATAFATLFYIRLFIIPWLAGDYMGHEITHYILWPHFEMQWPLYTTPDPSMFLGPLKTVNTWEIPALNTLILLTSGLTITVAHWGIIRSDRNMALTGQALTILLGLIFLTLQVYEYTEAYHVYDLKVNSGVYGNTFFLLTGLHGFHVFLGTVMLICIWARIYLAHFTPAYHFAFEAVAWYWHFVDVVWLILFVFVYWI